MNLEPIKKKRIFEVVIERIKSSIENGEINPGDKLPSERVLATKMQVSRSAIREALSVMASNELLEIKTGIGVFVKKVHTDFLLRKINAILLGEAFQMLQILEVRQAIEGEAAFLAAKRATEKDILSIENAYLELVTLIEKEHIAADEDFQFHLRVVQASNNKMLEKMIDLISDYYLEGLHTSRGDDLTNPERLPQILIEHKEIFEAIKIKDGNLAREKMWNHIENVKKRTIFKENK